MVYKIDVVLPVRTFGVWQVRVKPVDVHPELADGETGALKPVMVNVDGGACVGPLLPSTICRDGQVVPLPTWTATSASPCTVTVPDHGLLSL